MHGLAERADVRSGHFGTRSSCRVDSGVCLRAVFVFDAMPAALLPQMLAQQLPGARIEQAHVRVVPLHLNAPADPARRRAVVGGFDFHAAVQMHRALAVLVIAKGFDGQRQQRRLLLGEHGRHLAFGSAVDARVGPALFPAVEVGLRFVQALEAQPFERRVLRVADAPFDFALSIRVVHPAGQRLRTMCRGIVAGIAGLYRIADAAWLRRQPDAEAYQRYAKALKLHSLSLKVYCEQLD